MFRHILLLKTRHRTIITILLALWLNGLMPFTAVSYSPHTDILKQAPRLPHFFWNSPESSTKARICAELNCDPHDHLKHQDTLEYLSEHLRHLTENRHYSTSAPTPTILVVKTHPDRHNHNLNPVFFNTHSVWTNVLIKDKKNRHRHSFQPSKYLRLTPDNIILKRFDKLIFKPTLDLNFPHQTWFNQHRNWLAQSIPRCQFYPSPDTPMTLLSACQGPSIQSHATEVIGVDPYLIIPLETIETLPKNDLLAATIRAMADYETALPAFDSTIQLHNSFVFLTSDHNNHRHQGHIAPLQTSVTLKYKLDDIDNAILLSPEIMLIMATLDAKLRQMRDKKNPTITPLLDFPAFSESANAAALTAKLSTTKAYQKHQVTVSEWLLEHTKTDQLSPHTVLHVISYLAHHLPFHILLQAQTELINHYDEFSFEKMVQLIDFNQLENDFYGIDKLDTFTNLSSTNLTTITFEISQFFKLMPVLANNDNKSNLKNMLEGLENYLIEQEVIVHKSKLSIATLTGHELSQIYHSHRFRHQRLIMDPEFFLILAILESHLANYALFHERDATIALSDYLYSYSDEAKNLVDQIFHQLIQPDISSFNQRLNQYLPYVSEHPNITLSQTNLLLLIGLYYERFPFYVLQELENGILDFYLDNPMGMLNHSLDFTQLAEHHFYLEGNLYLPHPIRSRIKHLIKSMLKEYRISQPTSWNFEDYAYSISSLLNHHKMTLADKHFRLIAQSLYLYNFNLRQDEITQYYLNLAHAPSQIYVDYLIAQIPKPDERLECRNILAQAQPQTLVTTLVPLMHKLGQYSRCWRAINVFIEQIRHGSSPQ